MASTLTATRRTERGKGAARTLRREGRVPAVMYGHGDSTDSLSIDALELERLIATISVENTLIEVQLEGGESTRALIREVQWHPYRPIVLHVDFLKVHAGETLKLDIPIRLSGTPVGVRDQGGVLQQVLHSLHVECLPRNIPEVIEIDVSELGVGENISVRDVRVPDVTITNDPDLAVCSVTPPTVAALPEDSTASDTPVGDVEPELIGREGEGVDDVPTSEQGG